MKEFVPPKPFKPAGLREIARELDFIFRKENIGASAPPRMDAMLVGQLRFFAGFPPLLAEREARDASRIVALNDFDRTNIDLLGSLDVSFAPKIAKPKKSEPEALISGVIGREAEVAVGLNC